MLNFFFKIGDLKVYNIVCGLMTYASRHPCYACEAYKDENGNWVGSDVLRTWNSIIKHYMDWMDPEKGKGKESTRKNYYNCVNVLLIGFQDDQLVSHYLAPPGLHLYLSLNHILDSLG